MCFLTSCLLSSSAVLQADVAFVEQVIGPLKSHLEAIDALRPAMNERDLTKIDYDAR